jgi:hypothetical protein
MTDSPPPRDRTRINISELLEVRYWCKTLQISEAQLRDAVISGGSSELDRVREYLRDHC